MSMTKSVTNQEIVERLERIEKQVKVIKDRIEDDYLTPEEEEAILEARKDYKEGRLKSHEQLKKELGL